MKSYDKGILQGVLIALGIIYEHDQETVAEEIVNEIGAAALLQEAKAEKDYYLPNLRKTIKSLREPKMRGVKVTLERAREKGANQYERC